MYQLHFIFLQSFNTKIFAVVATFITFRYSFCLFVLIVTTSVTFFWASFCAILSSCVSLRNPTKAFYSLLFSRHLSIYSLFSSFPIRSQWARGLGQPQMIIVLHMASWVNYFLGHHRHVVKFNIWCLSVWRNCHC